MVSINAFAISKPDYLINFRVKIHFRLKPKTFYMFNKIDWKLKYFDSLLSKMTSMVSMVAKAKQATSE